MAFLAQSKKCDLIELAKELGLDVPSKCLVIDLKKLITESKSYDEPFVKNLLMRITEDRVEKQLSEEKEKERELKEKELEQIERDKQLSFELEKLRIEAEKQREENPSTVLNSQIRPSQVELKDLMHKYDTRDGDISFYLILFERQAKRVNLDEQYWVSKLIGLLPYEINQLIAREPEEKANDYQHIKQLILGRFKLTAEQFRQKFVNHARTYRNTWKDYCFELRNYFEEWIKGLEVSTFDDLKSLIITDQLKKNIPACVRDHFIDEWPKFRDPENLAEKLDAYENVRNGVKSGFTSDKYSPKRFNPSNQDFVSRPFNEYSKTKHFNKIDHNFENSRKNNYFYPNENYHFKPHTENKWNPTFGKREFKCYNCNEFGNHLAKNCPKPKVTTNMHKSDESNRKRQNYENKSEERVNAMSQKLTPLSVCMKRVKVNNVSLEALIDTGSSLTLLRKHIADQLCLEVEKDERRLFGIGNSTTVTLGKIQAQLQIDKVTLQTELFLVKDEAQPYDLIIGRDILNKDVLAYGKIGNSFNVWYKNEIPFSELQHEVNNEQIKLNSDSPIEIKANAVNFVTVKSNDMISGNILLENKNESPDSILELVDGKTVVPVVNIGKVDIKYKENQCVCRATKLTEDWEISDIKLSDSNDDNSLNVCIVTESRRDIKLEDLKFDKSASDGERYEVLKLLNEYRDCVAFNLRELGCTNLTKMNIKEVEESKPVCSRAYRTNATERNTIKQIVDEWKANGIVSETRSPYASPVLLVKKKTGEQRLVIDYRRLNSQTVKDKFPLPRIDDLLETLGKSKLFTTLDLAHGYLQIPLTEDAKLKTAFITPDDTGQFERMIFGLANAPSEFQRLMHCVLGPLLNTKALCYLDDILIPAKSWEDMLLILREVLERLRTAHLTLKLSKCEFGKTEVEFLGFIINENGIKPGTRKIRAIQEFPEPKNIHEVRKFLGLTGYFRRFVTNYAQKAEPLTRLTQKNRTFEWKEQQKASFQLLKDQLTSDPILAHYQPNVDTEVHCDASAEGLSGMLMQRGQDGKWHLVYSVSKKTSETEKKYHSSRLELMAIVWTLDRLRQFLIGIKFKIVTDCQALVYMNAQKTTNPQIARWCSLIQEYDFDITHRPGKKIPHVDALSRAPVSEADDTVANIVENFEVCQTLTEEEQILMIQHSDKELKRMIDVFKKQKHNRSAEDKNLIKDYVFKRNRLFKRIIEKGKEKLLYVIPKPMRKGIVVKFHDLYGHFSVDRTVAKIKESYWFPRMKRYVRHHISMCFQCLLNKTPSGKRQGELHPIKPGRRPFAIIHVDHLGPFVKSSKGNRELFVLIDNFTRFTRLYPMKSTLTKCVMIALKSFVNDFGLPERIISDRGTCFTSKEFNEYCRNNGIKHTLNSTQHPEGNGMVERANRTILSTIKTSMESSNHRDWDKRIKECERNLNNMINKTTGRTPFELLHGYRPKFHDGLIRMMSDEDSNQWVNPVELQDETRKIIENKQNNMKTYYDKKRNKSLTFEVGEIVVVRRLPKSTGDSTKTQPKYRGPLIITEILPSDTYRVTQLEDKTRGQFYSTTAHVSQLKSWHCTAESDEDEDYADNDNDDIS